MATSEKELESILLEIGINLGKPTTSLKNLLALLDRLDFYLSRVPQSPSEAILNALSPNLKALVSDELLRHEDVDVKVAIASCLSEMTRITAPQAPYDDEKTLKEVFQLIVSSFEHLDDVSSKSYNKRISILETVANVRSCAVMLDFEFDELILEMFWHFVKGVRYYHPENVIKYMESIMIRVIEESEEIPSDLLFCILESVRKSNKEVLPVARKLMEKVIETCADKLRPYIEFAVRNSGITLAYYGDVVNRICKRMSEESVVKSEHTHASDVEMQMNASKSVEPLADTIQTDEAKSNDEPMTAKFTIKRGRRTKMKRKTSKPNQGGKSTSAVRQPDEIAESHKNRVVSTLENLTSLDGKMTISAVGDLEEGTNILSSDAVREVTAPAVDEPLEGVESGVGKSLKQSGVPPEDTHGIEYDWSKTKDGKKRRGRGLRKASLQKHAAAVENTNKKGTTSQKSSFKSDKDDSVGTLKTSTKRKRIEEKKNEIKGFGDGEDLVGSNVKVWWPVDKRYYKGVIESFDSAKKKHKVLYDDGDVEHLILKNQRWEVITPEEYSNMDDESGQETPNVASGKRQKGMETDGGTSRKSLGRLPSSKSKSAPTNKHGRKSRDDSKAGSKGKGKGKIEGINKLGKSGADQRKHNDKSVVEDAQYSIAKSTRSSKKKALHLDEGNKSVTKSGKGRKKGHGH